MGPREAPLSELEALFVARVSARRYVGLRNRIVGGMLLRLDRRGFNERRSSPCSSRFQTLGAPCQGGDPTSGRFGSDPVFRKTHSDLFRADMMHQVSHGRTVVRAIACLAESYAR